MPATATAPNPMTILELDPREIIVDRKLNARRTPRPKRDIVQLAQDFIGDTGQLHPVEVRRAGNQYQLVMGFTRYDAAMLVINGEKSGNVSIKANPNFKLQAIESTRSDAEAYMVSVIENKHRGDTNALDDAYAVQVMKDEHKLSDKDICNALGTSSTWLAVLRGTLQTVPEIQKLVGTGDILPREAAEFSKLAPEQQKAIAAEVRSTVEKEGTRLSPIEVPKAAPASGKNAGKTSGKTPAAKPKTKRKTAGKQHRSKAVAKTVKKAAKTHGIRTVNDAGPSRTEIRGFWHDLAVTDDNEQIKALGKAVVKWMDGDQTNKPVLNAVAAMAGTPAPARRPAATQAANGNDGAPAPVRRTRVQRPAPAAV